MGNQQSGAQGRLFYNEPASRGSFAAKLFVKSDNVHSIINHIFSLKTTRVMGNLVVPVEVEPNQKWFF